MNEAKIFCSQECIGRLTLHFGHRALGLQSSRRIIAPGSLLPSHSLRDLLAATNL
jgi:hypothetical protein